MVVFKHQTLILDASCVISLYASEYIVDILRTIPPNITVAAYVANKEALYIRGEKNEQGKRPKIPINLQPLIQQRLLTLVEENSEAEAAIHTNLAAQIRGHGEVVTAAIAIHRDWGIVVDDKRARNLFNSAAPHIQLLYTLDLVRYWIEQTGLEREQIEVVLERIQYQASFYPNSNDPNYGWWHSFFSQP